MTTRIDKIILKLVYFLPVIEVLRVHGSLIWLLYFTLISIFISIKNENKVLKLIYFISFTLYLYEHAVTPEKVDHLLFFLLYIYAYLAFSYKSDTMYGLYTLLLGTYFLSSIFKIKESIRQCFNALLISPCNIQGFNLILYSEKNLQGNHLGILSDFFFMFPAVGFLGYWFVVFIQLIELPLFVWFGRKVIFPTGITIIMFHILNILVLDIWFTIHIITIFILFVLPTILRKIYSNNKVILVQEYFKSAILKFFKI